MKTLNFPESRTVYMRSLDEMLDQYKPVGIVHITHPELKGNQEKINGAMENIPKIELEYGDAIEQIKRFRNSDYNPADTPLGEFLLDKDIFRDIVGHIGKNTANVPLAVIYNLNGERLDQINLKEESQKIIGIAHYFQCLWPHIMINPSIGELEEDTYGQKLSNFMYHAVPNEFGHFDDGVFTDSGRLNDTNYGIKEIGDKSCIVPASNNDFLRSIVYTDEANKQEA